MNRSPERLYDLLPDVYRLRDSERGEPLRALLEVIAEQVNLVDADIGQMYDNWFIETCDDWVVPYIADLLGYEMLHNPGALDDFASAAARARNKILIPRRDAANVIRYRRRKGVLSLLELLARDAANYPAARAVEFFTLLGWAQNLNFLHLNRGGTVDLRDGNALDLINGPFKSSARTVDVRRASSRRTQGRYNVPGVGVFIWRLKTHSVTKTPAYCLEEESPECYTFSVLGNDTTLVNRPDPETEPTDIAGELNLPVPIRRRAFEERVFEDRKLVRTNASKNYYDRSLSVFLLDRKGDLKLIPRESIIPSNLSDWGKYRPKRDFVAVDTERGRIIFPPNQKPRYGVVVSYHYAFPADIGGGEYKRTLSQPKDAVVYRVGKGEEFTTINSALTAWEKDNKKPGAAVIEIQDSGVYTEPLIIELKPGESLQLRAANQRRPVIRLLDYQSSMPDSLSIKGDAGSRFTLDGLLIAGRSVQISGPDLSNYGDSDIESDKESDSKKIDNRKEHQSTGDLCEVAIRHCTLVPGWSLHPDCEPQRPNEPSLELEYTGAKVRIEHSIVGTILVDADERAAEPADIRISDSILDATSEDRLALGTFSEGLAYVRLSIARTTVIGKIKAHAIELAENSIFDGQVKVGRRQTGCFRFSYVAPESRTPRRFACQPDLVERAVEEAVKAKAVRSRLTALTPDEIEAAKLRERMRVKPKFNSLRYGSPAFCQLAASCADEIKNGAHDESEMGVYHDLYQPQRELNLRTRLDEYTPADADVGIFYAS